MAGLLLLVGPFLRAQGAGARDARAAHRSRFAKHEGFARPFWITRSRKMVPVGAAAFQTDATTLTGIPVWRGEKLLVEESGGRTGEMNVIAPARFGE